MNPILFDADNGSGSGADFTVPEGHTLLTNAELKNLNQKSFENGINEANERRFKAMGKKIAPLGIQAGEDFDSTLDAIIEAFNGKGKTDNEQIQTYEVKVKTLSEQLQKLEDERNKAYEARDSYIVDQELSNAFNGQVVDNAGALTILKNEYSIIRKSDGTLSIKDRSGNRVTNPKTGDPATLQEVAELFLTAKPYLKSIKERVETIKTPNGMQTDADMGRILNKPKEEMSSAEQRKIFEAAKSGALDGFIVNQR